MRLLPTISVVCFFTINLFGQTWIPIVGKWNAYDPTKPQDYVGVWKTSPVQRAYLDGTGNGTIDNITAVFGIAGDIPFGINYRGDERDEIALYRPSTGQVIFFSDFTSGTSYESFNTGIFDALPISGDWVNDSDSHDGYALYRPSTGVITYFQSYNSTSSLITLGTGLVSQKPISGDWNNNGADELALYDPSTRDMRFYQSYNSTTLLLPKFDVGNPGDIPIAGDWNGTGGDEFALFRVTSSTTAQFWTFQNYPNLNVLTGHFDWTDVTTYDISAGKQVFYTDSVPHTSIDGTYMYDYVSGSSLFPKMIEKMPGDAINALYAAGFNVGNLFIDSYPVTTSIKTDLDNTGNNFRLVMQYMEIGGMPLAGRFNGTKSIHGVYNYTASSPPGSDQYIAFDSDADGKFDVIQNVGFMKAFVGDWNGNGTDGYGIFYPSNGQLRFAETVNDPPSSPINLPSPSTADVPFGVDWDADANDEYAIYNSGTGALAFYPTISSTTASFTRTVGTGLIVLAGDWDGNGKDGFALYYPSTREVQFFQEYNAVSYFHSDDIGNFGDIPVAGDWDNDGDDGIAVYRKSTHKQTQDFWMYDIISPSFQGLTSGLHTNPLIETIDNKYLFGIYIKDEPATQDPGSYTTLVDIYDEYSSSPLLFYHTDSHPDNMTTWTQFAKIGEAVSHDDYPIGSQTFKSVLRVASTMTSSRLATSKERPQWYMAQAFSEIGDPRFTKPTADQLRAMVYTGIVHGATGISYFKYHDPLGSTHPGISPTHYTDLWNEAANINGEIDILTPYLLNVTPPAQEHSYRIYVKTEINPFFGETTPIRTLMKKNDNGDYILIAVNMIDQTLNAIIALPNAFLPENGIVTRINETNINALAGGIADTFSPFDVHIYKINVGNLNSGARVAIDNQTLTSELKEESSHAFSVFPNPSRSSFTFSIDIDNISDFRLFDVTGCSVASSIQTQENGQFTITLSNTSAEIVFYQIVMKTGEHYSGKLLQLR